MPNATPTSTKTIVMREIEQITIPNAYLHKEKIITAVAKISTKIIINEANKQKLMIDFRFLALWGGGGDTFMRLNKLQCTCKKISFVSLMTCCITNT